jgi:hypothetical protein
MRVKLGRICGVAALCAGMLLCGDVAAQQSDAAQNAFDEARELMKQKRYADACAKFEESQRIEAGMATQFRLAECYEAMGKLASAWRNFIEVAAQARANKQPDRERFARSRADALEPRLSRIKLTVPAEVAALQGLRVSDNDERIPAASWGGYPVDPGQHALVANAPGYRPFSVVLEVTREAQQLRVAVPALQPDAQATQPPSGVPFPSDAPATAPASTPAAPAPAPPPDAPSEDGNGQLIAGIAVGALGLVGLGVGTAMGPIASSKHADSEPFCVDNQCTQEGLDIRSDARTLGTVGTVVFFAGAAMAVGGVVLVVTAPWGDDASEGHARLRLGPVAGQPGLGLNAGGSW